jgi:hypothetical protein
MVHVYLWPGGKQSKFSLAGYAGVPQMACQQLLQRVHSYSRLLFYMLEQLAEAAWMQQLPASVGWVMCSSPLFQQLLCHAVMYVCVPAGIY